MTAVARDRIDTLRGPSTSDLVFDLLHQRIVELDLPPGTRISEAEVARQVGSSRQPVRDAFFRLSKLGLLQVQPQKATVVTLISDQAVLRARFVRTALETETVSAAMPLQDSARSELARLLAEQEAAVAANDRVRFHQFDDMFHAAICAASGHGFAWTLIRENKSHMDRVRWLSLAFAMRTAFEDHVRIYDAMCAGAATDAVAAMRLHLSRIVDDIVQIRGENPQVFAPVTEPAR